MGELESATEVESRPEVEKQENGAVGAKTARSETPYPFFGLSHSIKVLEAVRRAGGNEAPVADVMRELGVDKPTDRMWSYGVPAATQFGLVERVGRGEAGRIKVTELGMRVVLPGTPEEGRAARIAAFKTPELYTKLLERYAGAPVPAKEGLKNILYRDYKIVESMSPLAAEAFLDSLKVADLVTSANMISLEGGSSHVAEDGPKKVADPTNEPPASAGTKTVHVPHNFVIYKCKIGGGKVIDIPLPPTFTQADAKRLHAFLLTQVDDQEEGGGATNP